MDDPIKRAFDDSVRRFASELEVLEKQARMLVGLEPSRSGIAAARLRADIVERLALDMRAILKRGGMPTLDKIDSIMNSPAVLHLQGLSKEKLEDILTKINDRKGLPGHGQE